MMNKTQNDTLHNDENTDQLALYALGMLPDDEARQLEIHIAGCTSCRAELDSYMSVADVLADGVPQAAPPPALKARLMDSLTAAPAHPTIGERLRSLLVNRPRLLPVSAALGAMLFLIVYLWLLPGAEPAPDLLSFNLVGTDNAPDAWAVLTAEAGGTDGVIVINDLASLPEGQQYQLWLIDDGGNRDSGAVFSVTPGGSTEVAVSGAHPIASYTAFGITIEPAGGSPGPTGPKVLGGTS